MATTAASTPSTGGEDPAKLEILREALYEQCQNHGSQTRLFSQKDLLELGVIPEDNAVLLVRIVQALCDDKLLIPVNDPRQGLLWKWRSEEDALKYKSLKSEEAMVYAMVDEAGADGIWSRTLKARLNMHESLMKQTIKHLEAKGYISDMKSVEHPNKKMYIKANLRPSDRATGGPWYTDSSLDEGFIGELGRIIFDYVKRESAYVSTHQGGGGGGADAKQPKKGVVVRGGDVGGGKKRRAEDMSTDARAAVGAAAGTGTATAAAAGARKHRPKQALLPLPAGYTGYPSAEAIAYFIHETGITNNTTLSTADIQQLVDVLVYDGLLEPIRVGRKAGYRVARAAQLDPLPLTQLIEREKENGGPADMTTIQIGPDPGENGMTEAPCGRCPVFELCEEGGPVSASNCVYFNKWLGLVDDP